MMWYHYITLWEPFTTMHNLTKLNIFNCKSNTWLLKKFCEKKKINHLVFSVKEMPRRQGQEFHPEVAEVDWALCCKGQVGFPASDHTTFINQVEPTILGVQGLALYHNQKGGRVTVAAFASVRGAGELDWLCM